jgi:hypothetical protein
MVSIKRPRILQSGSGNAKIRHGMQDYKVLTLSLAASDSSGTNLCPLAFPVSRVDAMRAAGIPDLQIIELVRGSGLSACSVGCCVNRSGRGVMENVRGARERLSHWFREDRPEFLTALLGELRGHVKRAGGAVVAVRPNTNSDVPWERLCPTMFDLPIRFWDYTKVSTRLGRTPENYRLVYSVNDATTDQDWDRVHAARSSIAVVFDVEWQPSGRPEHRRFGVLPKTWTDPTGHRWRVIDGDKTDLRFTDPEKVCVGLRLKGTIAGREFSRCSGFAARVRNRSWIKTHPSMHGMQYGVNDNFA